MAPKKVNVVMVCTNSFGAPVFVAVAVEATPTEIDNGDHYDKAQELAEDSDYDGPFVCFDNNEMPTFLERALHAKEIPFLN